MALEIIDRNWEFPNRYHDQNGNQLTLTPDFGEGIEGTTANRALLQNVKNIQDLTYVGRDEAEREIRHSEMFCEITSPASSKWGTVDTDLGTDTLTGRSTTMFSDGSTISLTIKGSNPFRIDTTSYGDNVCLKTTYNGSSGYDLFHFNEILKRTEYSNSYHIDYHFSTASQLVEYIYDFKKSRKKTLNYYFANATKANFMLYGSDDNSAWIKLETLAETTDGSYEDNKGYRYIKVAIDSTGSSSTASINCLYFSDVQDWEPAYTNRFTTELDLNTFNHLMCSTDGSFTTDYVISNTINDIEVEATIQPQTILDLYKKDGVLKNLRKCVTGSFTSTTEIQTIDLGFEPDLVITYTTKNNAYNVDNDTNSGTQYANVPRVLTKAYKSGDGAITNNGFSHRAETSELTYYIALKF